MHGSSKARFAHNVTRRESFEDEINASTLL